MRNLIIAFAAGYAISKIAPAAIGKPTLKYEFGSNKEMNDFVKIYNDHQQAKRNAVREMDDELNELVRKSRGQ